MQKIIVALDGYSGTGKSSTAQAVAEKLNYTYIDSGAMYRAVTVAFLDANVDLENETEVTKVLSGIKLDIKGSHILLNGVDVSTRIRSMEVNRHVSAVSKLAVVRRAMVHQQKELGKGKEVVMDGRDIGTVVFPEADLKVFMTASSRVRAERRQLELAKKGINEELESIEANLLERDKIDSTRSESPLRKSEGAVELDTSYLTFDEQVCKIVELAEELIYEN